MSTFLSPSSNKKSKKQFTEIPKWLTRFSSTSTTNDEEYHYFSKPVEGYKQITVYDKGITVKRYLQIRPLDNSPARLEADTSNLKDFSYMQYLGIRERQPLVVNRQNLTRESEWIRKYQPKRFIDLLSDDKNNRVLLTWLKSWDPIVFGKQNSIGLQSHMPVKSTFFNNYKFSASNNRGGALTQGNTYQHANQKPTSNYNNSLNQLDYKKIVLLTGPPGCGKTTLARVLAKHCKYAYEEINASDDRSANALLTKVSGMTCNQTIRNDKQPTMIIIDEVDGALEGESSGLKAVIHYIETGQLPKEVGVNDKKDKKLKDKAEQKVHVKRPIIFICNDPYSKGMKQLRTKATVLYFPTIIPEKIVKRMKEICSAEKIHIDSDILSRICQLCNNDVRSCLGILELVCRMKRTENINPKQFLAKMKLSFHKDSQQSVNEFVSEIFYKKNNQKSQNNFFRNTVASIFKTGNSSLLLETFMANIHKSKQAKNLGSGYSRMSQLYEMIRFADFILKKDFEYHGELQRFLALPFCLYQIHFKTDDSERVEFPRSFIDNLNRHKTNKAIVDDMLSKMNVSARSSTNRRKLPLDELWAIYWSIQPKNLSEGQIIRCVARMICYDIEFSSNYLPSAKRPGYFGLIFKPDFEMLFTYHGKRPDDISLSNSSKTLMEQSYEFVKTRMQMMKHEQIVDLEGAKTNGQKQSSDAVNLLNKLSLSNRNRKRVPEREKTIRYRFQEGSGTEIRCELKLGYFA